MAPEVMVILVGGDTLTISGPYLKAFIRRHPKIESI